jgi:phosphoglycolate phosphatase-like HAD superfamily hydrolase
MDVQTGRSAHVKTIAVTYGFGRRKEIEASRPDSILNDLEELIECPLLKS